MKKLFRPRFVCGAMVSSAMLYAPSLFACAMCYGKSDSPLAKGMNAGIFVLLGVVVAVLGSLATFFIYLAKRAAAVKAPVADPAASVELIPTTQKA